MSRGDIIDVVVVGSLTLALIFLIAVSVDIWLACENEGGTLVRGCFWPVCVTP